MNGRHVLAPKGARAIQNPAYRPAGIFQHSAKSKGCAGRRHLLVQVLALSLSVRPAVFLETGAIKSCLAESTGAHHGPSRQTQHHAFAGAGGGRGRCRRGGRICLGERSDLGRAQAMATCSAIRSRNCASWCKRGSTAGRRWTVRRSSNERVPNISRWLKRKASKSEISAASLGGSRSRRYRRLHRQLVPGRSRCDRNRPRFTRPA